MNRTREQWSKDLGCCHREFNIFLFAVVSCIIGTLPLIFYGTLYALTKRQERSRILVEGKLYQVVLNLNAIFTII